MKEPVEFTAISKIIVTPNTDGKTALLSSCKIRMELSDNADKSKYLDPDGLPWKDGVKTLTNAFIQGLAANIHMAHDKGICNEVAHIQYIIDELGRSFAHVKTSRSSTF